MPSSTPFFFFLIGVLLTLATSLKQDSGLSSLSVRRIVLDLLNFDVYVVVAQFMSRHDS